MKSLNYDIMIQAFQFLMYIIYKQKNQAAPISGVLLAGGASD